jgi:hypothetical protein
MGCQAHATRPTGFPGTKAIQDPDACPTPTELELPCEYLRVFSPAAEVVTRNTPEFGTALPDALKRAEVRYLACLPKQLPRESETLDLPENVGDVQSPPVLLQRRLRGRGSAPGGLMQPFIL